MGVTGAGEVRAALKVLSVAVAIPQMRGWLLEARPPRHLLAQRATHSTVILRELLVLFPAVAVDAPGAGWQNAISDTRNRIWYAIAVTMLPFIPIGLLGIASVALLKAWMTPGSLTGMVAGLLSLGTLFLITTTLIAVIASRLYQVIGERLNAPMP